ncbi:hypothetical protein [Persicirhabdus sediminis]|uniref:DUF1573 domain-containing protein n=1 Tax=Persicirhabdus sediminis TaxID=454144 RepID=A0A8J7MIQ0_9BACT|nr:hypothetical protein [Persicirhabdus sediminis]MBK1791698.1 hypothetical protein [Persicirhabdus sediminis]
MKRLVIGNIALLSFLFSTHLALADLVMTLEERIDFAQIGPRKSNALVLENTGSKEVRVLEALSCCGATLVQPATIEIPAKSSLRLPIVFGPADESARFVYELTCRYGKNGSSKKVMPFMIHVSNFYKLNYTECVSSGNIGSFEIELTSSDHSIEACKVTNEDGMFKVDTVIEDGAVKGVVTVDTDVVYGRYIGTLDIVINDGDKTIHGLYPLEYTNQDAFACDDYLLTGRCVDGQVSVTEFSVEGLSADLHEASYSGKYSSGTVDIQAGKVRVAIENKDSVSWKTDLGQIIIRNKGTGKALAFYTLRVGLSADQE